MNELQEEDVQSYKRNYKLNFFACPDFKYQIPFILLVSFLISLLYFSSINQFLELSILVFVIPTIAAALLLPYFPSYKEGLNYNQSFFIALVSLSFSAAIALIHFLVNKNFARTMVVALTIPVSVRYLIFKATFVPRGMKAIPHATFQTLLSLPFIYMLSPFDLNLVMIFALLTILAIVVIELFFMAVDKPFKENFDTTARDLLRISLQLLKDNGEGREELKELFKRYSFNADVSYTLFSFKTGSEKKALFVIPDVHPGPMKGVGGGKLVKSISDKLRDHGTVFTFHGTATHKLNPLSEEECRSLAEDMSKELRDIEYYGKGTSFISTEEKPTVGAQRLGDALFTPVSFSPLPTEDIDPSMGKIMSGVAEGHGVSKLGVVDAHNCGKKGCSEVFYPSDRAQWILKDLESVLGKMKEKETGEIKMGVAVVDGYVEKKGISSDGIRTAVFEVNGEKNAFLLIDGNNMVKGLREAIQEGVDDLVDSSEVMTTDNHSVNTFVESYNPVGLNMDKERIVKDARETVKAALKDMEPVEVGVKKGEVSEFEVMGPITTDYMDAVIESVYHIVPYAAPMYLMIQLLGTVLILTFIP